MFRQNFCFWHARRTKNLIFYFVAHSRMKYELYIDRWLYCLFRKNDFFLISYKNIKSILSLCVLLIFSFNWNFKSWKMRERKNEKQKCQMKFPKHEKKNVEENKICRTEALNLILAMMQRAQSWRSLFIKSLWYSIHTTCLYD